MSTGRSSDSSCSRTFSTALFILPTTQHVLLQISPVTIIRYVSAGTLLWESGADPETVGERMGSLGRSSSVQGQSPSWKIRGKASRKLTTFVYLTLKNTKQLWSVCGLNSLLLHPLCTTNDADEKTHFLGGAGLTPSPDPIPFNMPNLKMRKSWLCLCSSPMLKENRSSPTEPHLVHATIICSLNHFV